MCCSHAIDTLVVIFTQCAVDEYIPLMCTLCLHTGSPQHQNHASVMSYLLMPEMELVPNLRHSTKPFVLAITAVLR